MSVNKKSKETHFSVFPAYPQTMIIIFSILDVYLYKIKKNTNEQPYNDSIILASQSVSQLVIQVHPIQNDFCATNTIY